MCSIARRSSPLRARRSGVSGPGSSTAIWGGMWDGGRAGRTGVVAGLGLHLAVAGKDVGLEIQTARGTQYFQEVFYLSFCVARRGQIIRLLRCNIPGSVSLHEQKFTSSFIYQ